jgi:hypothetical protein
MNAQASADGDYMDQMMKRANGASMDTSTVGHRGLSVSASAVNMGVEPELVRLRGRVHELESELTICKDELSRARSLIEQDKDSSTRLHTCTIHTCKYAHKIVEFSPNPSHSPFLVFSSLESTKSITKQGHVAVLLETSRD